MSENQPTPSEVRLANEVALRKQNDALVAALEAVEAWHTIPHEDFNEKYGSAFDVFEQVAAALAPHRGGEA